MAYSNYNKKPIFEDPLAIKEIKKIFSEYKKLIYKYPYKITERKLTQKFRRDYRVIRDCINCGIDLEGSQLKRNVKRNFKKTGKIDWNPITQYAIGIMTDGLCCSIPQKDMFDIRKHNATEIAWAKYILLKFGNGDKLIKTETQQEEPREVVL